MNGKINAWWQKLPLKTKTKYAIGEDLAVAMFSAVFSVACWRNPQIARWTVVGWGATEAITCTVHAWRKWRALHSPLFYLAAVKHDLGGNNAAPVTKEPT